MEQIDKAALNFPDSSHPMCVAELNMLNMLGGTGTGFSKLDYGQYSELPYLMTVGISDEVLG